VFHNFFSKIVPFMR